MLAHFLLFSFLDDQIGAVTLYLRLALLDRLLFRCGQRILCSSVAVASGRAFRCSAKVAGSPIGKATTGVSIIGLGGSSLWSGRIGVSHLCLLVDGLDFVLGRGSLVVAHLFVALFVGGVEFARTGIPSPTHLLPHHL